MRAPPSGLPTVIAVSVTTSILFQYKYITILGKSVFKDDVWQLSKNGTTESSCVADRSSFFIRPYLVLLYFVLLCFTDVAILTDWSLWQSCVVQAVGAIFPTVYAYFLSLCHVLVILAISETFSLWSHLLLGTYDLWLLMLSLQFTEGSDDDQNVLAIKYV